MRSIIVLGLLSSMALVAAGCATGDESEAELVGQASQAFSKSAYFWDGPTLFNAYTLYQNCTLTVETTNASSTRDPILALIINNSLGWGSATVPCNHGTATQTDTFATLAFNENISTTNYNAKVSYKNTSGGAGVTVFAVGFLTNSTNFGNLNVKYSITGCTDTTKNKAATTSARDFHASGVKGSFPGEAYTWEPRPGGPEDARDTVLFGLDPANYGYGRCNDNCPAPRGTPTLSCLTENTGSNLWWFSPGWHWGGNGVGYTSVNNP